MKNELIVKTEQFLKKKFDDSEYYVEHPDGKAYRLEHSYRVANIGRIIAQNEGFDETEMVIACLLHDVSYCEVFDDDGWINHGRTAARIARPFLSEPGLPEHRSFILPGGCVAASAVHVARTVCRRAERLVICLQQEAQVPENVTVFLNRLSDYLFLLARKANLASGTEEIMWK